MPRRPPRRRRPQRPTPPRGDTPRRSARTPAGGSRRRWPDPAQEQSSRTGRGSATASCGTSRRARCRRGPAGLPHRPSRPGPVHRARPRSGGAARSAGCHRPAPARRRSAAAPRPGDLHPLIDPVVSGQQGPVPLRRGRSGAACLSCAGGQLGWSRRGAGDGNRTRMAGLEGVRIHVASSLVALKACQRRAFHVPQRQIGRDGRRSGFSLLSARCALGGALGATGCGLPQQNVDSQGVCPVIVPVPPVTLVPEAGRTWQGERR
jgi:hypothetical protein